MRHDRNNSTSGQHIIAVASLVYGIVAALDIYPLLGQRTIGSVYSLVFISLVMLLDRPSPPTTRPARQLLYVAVIGLLLWSTVTMLWASPQSPAISRFISLAQVCITFGALMVVTPAFRRWIALGLALGATLAAIILYTHGEAGTNGRLSYGSVDENITAYSFALGVAAFITLINRKSTLLLYSVPIFLLFVATIQTGSRTGIAAILVTILVTPLLRFSGRQLGRTAVGVGVIAVCFGIFRAFALRWEDTPDRLRPLLEGDVDIDDSGRGAINDQYLQFIDEWWLFGTGLAGGNDFIQSRVAVFSHSAHNTILRVWIETGLIGLILIGAIYTLTIYLGLSNPAVRRYLTLLVPSLAFSLTLGGLELSSAFWVSIALVAGSNVALPDSSAREGAARHLAPLRVRTYPIQAPKVRQYSDTSRAPITSPANMP